MNDVYAVIGHPVAHSLSPQIHAEFARASGQHLTYEKLLAPLDGFAACIAALRGRGGKGVNITLPFKLEAYKLATHTTERAQHAQAVNTLRFDADKIFGDNTDGSGLTRDLEINLGVSLQDKRVLMLGAGGAARGVILPLLERKPAALMIANRTVEKANELAAHFARWGSCAASAYADLRGRQFDVVINATSSGLQNTMPPLPENLFAANALAYDMVYGKASTPFMVFAQASGARISDGLGMLVEQAAESFFIWRDVRPETSHVLATLRAQLMH